MIIYGTGEKKLATPHQQTKSKCPHCGETGITFHFFKKYFHLFWIPVCPYGSRQVAYCEKCHTTYQENIPSSLRFELENEKSRTSTPFTLFTGSFLLAAGIWALFYFHDDMDTYYYPSHKKQATGRTINNKPDGKWTYWYENGNLQAEQYYKNGDEDSVWTWYDEKGIKTKVGGYRNGVYHGKWLFYYPSGKLQEEDLYVDNRKQGQSILYFENGNKVCEGSYERDREQGPWTYWYESGNKMSEGEYNRGMKTGPWKLYFENGKLNCEMRYADSLTYFTSIWDEDGNQLVKDGQGTYITNYPNKQKSAEGKIRNGIYDGLWTYWYADGTLSELGKFNEGVYTLINSWDQNGKSMVAQGNGYHKTFHENGVVSSECLYRNGKPHGLMLTRTADNMMISEINYVEGRLEGKAKYYQETGELLNEGLFKNNKQDGIWTWYHMNGEREAEANFIQGKKDGEETFWSESGEIVKREFYKMGELIREETY